MTISQVLSICGSLCRSERQISERPNHFEKCAYCNAPFSHIDWLTARDGRGDVTGPRCSCQSLAVWTGGTYQTGKPVLLPV